jgi:hypothetical protein
MTTAAAYIYVHDAIEIPDYMKIVNPFGTPCLREGIHRLENPTVA